MVREANGQNKLRFSQVFWTLFLVVTLSHDFSKCEKHIAIYEETYIKRRIFFIYFEILYIFLCQLISAVLFGGYSTLRYSFEVEVAYIYFSYRSIWHPCVMIASFFSSMQLFICFHRPVIFPDVVIFSQCFQVSTFIFFSFPAQQFTCRFQCTFFKTVRKNNVIFSVLYFLSFPTGTRTSLQVEYNSYVLVGGIGSLLLFFCLCLYSINITSILIKCFYIFSEGL